MCHLVFNYTEVGTLKFSEKNKKRIVQKVHFFKKKTLGKVNVWDLGEGICIMYSLYFTADGLIGIQSTILQAFYWDVIIYPSRQIQQDRPKTFNLLEELWP